MFSYVYSCSYSYSYMYMYKCDAYLQHMIYRLVRDLFSGSIRAAFLLQYGMQVRQ